MLITRSVSRHHQQEELYATGQASEAKAGGKAGLIYLSSSVATSSTKIRGPGGVLWGKELEHLEGGTGVGGWRIIPRWAHQERLLVSKGTVEELTV